MGFSTREQEIKFETSHICLVWSYSYIPKTCLITSWLFRSTFVNVFQPLLPLGIGFALIQPLHA